MRRVRPRRLALTAALVCLAIPFALPGGAGSRVTNATLDADGVLAIEGSSGDDDITLRHVTGVANPSQIFVEVHDPAGIDVVPSDCFRKDANTIHCPDLLVSVVALDVRAGDDRVRNELSDFIEVVDVEPTAVDGGGGDDQLEGGEARDELEGGEGDDRLSGQTGNDKLFGGAGKDKLTGGPGKDKLVCGGGRDVAAGGRGKDTAKGCERSKSL